MANVDPQKQWWVNYYAWYNGQPPVSPWQAMQYGVPQYQQYGAPVSYPQYVQSPTGYVSPQPYQPVVTQQYAAPVASPAVLRAQQRQACAAAGGVWRGNQCVARTTRQTRMTVAQMKQACASQGGLWRGNKCYAMMRDGSAVVTGQAGTTVDPSTGQVVTTYTTPATPTTQVVTPSGQAPAVEDLPDMQYGESGGESYGGESMSGLGAGEFDLKTIAILGAVGLGLYYLLREKA